MSHIHPYNPKCACDRCGNDDVQQHYDDETRETFRDDLMLCPDFIGELSLDPDDCERVSAAIRDRDMAELGRIYAAALEREADDAIERRAEEDDMTPGQAAERLYDIYRPATARKAA